MKKSSEQTVPSPPPSGRRITGGGWLPLLAFVSCVLSLLIIESCERIAESAELDCGGWRAAAVTAHDPGSTAHHPLLTGHYSSPHAAVCRVAVYSGGGAMSYGSGTLIAKSGDEGIVITCSHLFDDGGETIWAGFPNGARSEASLIGRDPAWDLAAIQIRAPAVEPVAIAAEHPRPGERLESCGYGPACRYACSEGQARGYVQTGNTSTSETLELSGSAREGDSGGPVFNQRGELVAVIWGTNGRVVEGTFCGRIRKFLSQFRLQPPVSSLQPPVSSLQPPVSSLQPPACGRWGCRPGGGYQTIPGGVCPHPVPPETSRPQGGARPEAEDQRPEIGEESLEAIKTEILAEIRGELAKIQATAGPAGPAGPPGPQGPAGPQGPPGTPAPATSIDVDAIAAAVIEHLPPLPVRRQWMKRRGEPDPSPPQQSDEWVPYKEDVQHVYFARGDGITIRLFPPE